MDFSTPRAAATPNAIFASLTHRRGGGGAQEYFPLSRTSKNQAFAVIEKINVSLGVNADFFLVFASFIPQASPTRRVIPSFSLSLLKPPGCSGELAHHPVPFTLFFYLRVSRHPSLPFSFCCPYLTTLPRGRVGLSWGVVGALVTPHHTTPHHGTPEAVKNSSACQAWNFDIERKAGVTAPHRFRQEAKRRRDVRDHRDIY